MNGTPQPKVFIEHLRGDYSGRVRAGLEFTGFFDQVPQGSTVFLKPNLTFPTYQPGVMTSPECVAAVTETLIDRGYRVIIGEADSGGYNRFSIDEVFEKTGINALAQRTGARVVNISFTEPEWIKLAVGWREVSIPLPRLILREVDAFITLPVPKIHMNTMVSMSLKNQWGCIQEPSERLKLHPYFSQVILEVCRRLPKAYSIIDGRYGLNGSGPMRGNAVELDWLLAANDLVAADRVCCRLMRIDEDRVGHLRHARARGWWPEMASVAFNRELEPFVGPPFFLKRQWTDYPGLLCFHSRFLAWLGYRSPLAGFLHWALYLFRTPFYDYEGERGKVRKKE